jgi:hypothetical protein
VSHVGFPPVAEEKPLLVSSKRGKLPPTTRSSLIASGLVVRPEGNRETASEMDRDLKRKAALELARANLP